MSSIVDTSSTGSLGDSAPALAAPGLPFETSSRGPRSTLRRWWPAVAVVAIALLLVGLYAADHLAISSSTGVGGAVDYAHASQVASRAASSVVGGPWTLVAALGVDLAKGAVVAANASLGTGCTFSSPGGGVPPLDEYVPAYAGGLSSGAAPWWGLVYTESSGDSVLLIAVENGSLGPLLVATGSCTAHFSSLSPVPSSVLNSPMATAAAWSDGGSVFVSAHPGVPINLEFGLVNEDAVCAGATSGCWLLSYTPCNPLNGEGPAGNQSEFVAVVDAQSGSILTSLATGTTCGSTGSLEGTAALLSGLSDRARET